MVKKHTRWSGKEVKSGLSVHNFPAFTYQWQAVNRSFLEILSLEGKCLGWCCVCTFQIHSLPFSTKISPPASWPVSMVQFQQTPLFSDFDLDSANRKSRVEVWWGMRSGCSFLGFLAVRGPGAHHAPGRSHSSPWVNLFYRTSSFQFPVTSPSLHAFRPGSGHRCWG